jgi:AraC-like DNA-binding protein/quercetin dioxygenase-like cupin family protein
MNRQALLHATPELSVSRFDHPSHEVHHDPEHEVASHWGIAFVESGTFDVHVEGARHRLVAGSVFITRPGLEFRCGHGDECPDDVCLSIRFDDAAVAGNEDAWMRARWLARAAATPRLSYTHRRLSGAAHAADGFAMERWALAGMLALDDDADAARTRGVYAPRASALDAVAAACHAIEGDAVARRSVADRAREVGLTSTQLTHAFRRYLGLSPHQYVVRHRLAAASQLLDDGASVSDACWRSGFENLSHFCRSFARALGCRPSAWHRQTPRERRRKVQALLRGDR